MTKFISQSIVFGFILSQSRVGNQKVLLSLFLNINKVLNTEAVTQKRQMKKKHQ